MVELRCNSCSKNKGDYCAKLKVPLVNGHAKLYYGGAIGVHAQGKTYPSKCKIESEVTEETISERIETAPETYVTQS